MWVKQEICDSINGPKVGCLSRNKVPGTRCTLGVFLDLLRGTPAGEREFSVNMLLCSTLVKGHDIWHPVCVWPLKNNRHDVPTWLGGTFCQFYFAWHCFFVFLCLLDVVSCCWYCRCSWNKQAAHTIYIGNVTLSCIWSRFTEAGGCWWRHLSIIVTVLSAGHHTGTRIVFKGVGSVMQTQSQGIKGQCK